MTTIHDYLEASCHGRRIIATATRQQAHRVKDMQVVMHRLDGHTPREIADYIGETRQNVRIRTQRGAPYVEMVLRSIR